MCIALLIYREERVQGVQLQRQKHLMFLVQNIQVPFAKQQRGRGSHTAGLSWSCLWPRSCVTTFPWSYPYPCPIPQQNTLAQDSWVLAQPQSFLKEICSDPGSPKDKKMYVTTCSKAHSFDAMTFVIYLANWIILNSNKAAVTVATAEEKTVQH